MAHPRVNPPIPSQNRSGIDPDRRGPVIDRSSAFPSSRARAIEQRKARWGRYAAGAVLGVTLFAPMVCYARAQQRLASPDAWQRVTAALETPRVSNSDVIRAAQQDMAAHEASAARRLPAFAYYLLASTSAPRIQLDAARAATIFEELLLSFGEEASTFWSTFALATLLQLAGEDERVAEVLARALRNALAEDIPAATVARTAGIMGHAQQSAGFLQRSRRTFERLRTHPIEREHAVIHLGELALANGEIAAAIDIWLAHPAGVWAGVRVITDEADALWRQDPAKSYRLVAAALDRVRTLPENFTDPRLDTAVARLAARSRENAVPPGVVREAKMPEVIKHRE